MSVALVLPQKICCVGAVNQCADGLWDTDTPIWVVHVAAKQRCQVKSALVDLGDAVIAEGVRCSTNGYLGRHCWRRA